MVNYPGRMLPFYAVNPNRRNFVERTKQCLCRGGFVGVKLYPSLGYSLTDAGMSDVMQYCNDNEIPMLMHCNQGGFKKDNVTADNCSPKLWGLVDDGDGFLDTFPKLKICFAHFGGSENFVQKQPNGSFQDVFQSGSWSSLILALMGSQGYRDRVFADVSFHEDSLPGPLASGYLGNLATIIAREECRGQVLWGSDTWLLRMVSTEIDYWHGFTGQYILPIEHFHLMWDANPRKFLGFGDGNPARYTPNIWAHVRYMEENRARFASGQDIHPWLEAAMAVPEKDRRYPAAP
nr:amidohydrolase family protein [Fundidesulfovibrio terrae]